MVIVLITHSTERVRYKYKFTRKCYKFITMLSTCILIYVASINFRLHYIVLPFRKVLDICINTTYLFDNQRPAMDVSGHYCHNHSYKTLFEGHIHHLLHNDMNMGSLDRIDTSQLKINTKHHVLLNDFLIYLFIKVT